MAHNPKNRGFTLVELVVAMALSLIAVTAAVLLITKFARSVGAFTETSTLEEARGSSETIIRADFDGAGLNLTRPSAPGAGKESVMFSPNPDFNTGPGTYTKLNDNSSWIYSTRSVPFGPSLLQWTPATICKHCWVYIAGSDGNLDAIGMYYDESGGSSIVIYESRSPSGTVASSFGTGASIPSHLPGDTYQIGIENPNAQQPERFARFYRIRNGVRTILYTGTYAVPAYPHYVMAYAANSGSSVNNISLIGAPIEYRTNNQTEFARLPFDGGTQLTGPITLTNGGTAAIILAGDRTTDATPAVTNFASDSTEIDIKTPRRGSFAAGDVVMLIDYGSNDPNNPVSPASAVCPITAVTTVDAQTTRLTLSRARQTTPAWGRLWSSDTDHSHTFAANDTTVVKLAPPVTYTLSTDNRLVRIEGARASTIAFNARQLAFIQTSTAPYLSYTGQVTIAAEGFETGTDPNNETRGTIEFTSTPRALNLASNQLN